MGLVAMRFSPECIQCGSAVMDTDILGRVPSKAVCQGCNATNKIESMISVKISFSECELICCSLLMRS